MEIGAYLERIGYTGECTITLQTLTAIHEAHLRAIPYENLDIHLGRTLSLDIEAIYDKIVTRRRGGWCYEMNGLLSWALRELGFAVTTARAGTSPTTTFPMQTYRAYGRLFGKNIKNL